MNMKDLTAFLMEFMEEIVLESSKSTIWNGNYIKASKEKFSFFAIFHFFADDDAESRKNFCTFKAVGCLTIVTGMIGLNTGATSKSRSSKFRRFGCNFEERRITFSLPGIPC
uniref:Uncharacterized protein n=1 Tax=Romanomermis culicivorax TaxID=13658 RepID=A0A915I1G6_ROMCU